MRELWYLTLGCVAFVAITLFEQVPIIGWLGAALSIAAWILIARALVAERSLDFDTPLVLGWSALIGGATGLVGAITAWLAQTGNLIGLATPPGDRFGAAFGFVGATLGILYWPLMGAIVCVVAALAAVRWRRAV